MYIGRMELHFALYGAGSIKDKRSVVKRIQYRTRHAFNVSMAEVEEHDCLDRAVLGVVTVGADGRYLEGLLQRVEQFVERLALAELLEAPRAIEQVH